jgi:hypothetical protein
MTRDAPYQQRVADWMQVCFGPDISADIAERCLRFFEEAGELCQALGMSEDTAHALVAYTWGREAGDPGQEVGGVVVTLAALCQAARMDMMADGETELARISDPEIIRHIRAKHAAKPLRSGAPAG